MTVREALRESALSGLDAEVLLAHVLGCSRTDLLTEPARPLAPAAERQFGQMARQRQDGVPVAYLTGEKEFWSLKLRVTPDVLVPRPETELLIEWTLELLPPPPAGGGRGEGGLRIADLGTGSGAIALALARELPAAQIFAVDASAAALAVAQGNAQTHGLRNVRFLEGSWFEPLDSRLRGNDGFDLLVSNPPYIAESDAHLQDLRYEPAAALTAGPEGLDALREIIAGARRHLRPGGWLLVEHGATQGPSVRGLFVAAGFTAVETRRDLAGLERATGGRVLSPLAGTFLSLPPGEGRRAERGGA